MVNLLNKYRNVLSGILSRVKHKMQEFWKNLQGLGYGQEFQTFRGRNPGRSGSGSSEILARRPHSGGVRRLAGHVPRGLCKPRILRENHILSGIVRPGRFPWRFSLLAIHRGQSGILSIREFRQSYGHSRSSGAARAFRHDPHRRRRIRRASHRSLPRHPGVPRIPPHRRPLTRTIFIQLQNRRPARRRRIHGTPVPEPRPDHSRMRHTPRPCPPQLLRHRRR